MFRGLALLGFISIPLTVNAGDCSVITAFPTGQKISSQMHGVVKSNHIFIVNNTKSMPLDYRLCKQHLMKGLVGKESFFDGNCKMIRLEPGQSYSENQELSLYVLFKVGHQNANSTLLSSIDGGCHFIHSLEASTYIF